MRSAQTGSERIGAVRFADGEEIAADLVVMAIGIRPNTRLAEEAGHLWLWPAESTLAPLQASVEISAASMGATGNVALRFDPATNQLHYAVTLAGLQQA